MSFYIVSNGASRIEDIFAGKTPEDVVQAARSMINQWPEYIDIDDDEIIELAEAGDIEFDLVEIPEDFPENASKEALINLYNKYWSGK